MHACKFGISSCRGWGFFFFFLFSFAYWKGLGMDRIGRVFGYVIRDMYEVIVIVLYCIVLWGGVWESGDHDVMVSWCH